MASAREAATAAACGGRFRPPSFMNRSMAGETVEGSESDDAVTAARSGGAGARRGRPSRRRGRAGAAVAAARRGRGLGLAEGGADPGEEQGRGEDDRQAWRFLIGRPTPSEGSSIRSGAWAVPADPTLVAAGRADALDAEVG